jgi:hypothetical protein
MERCICIRVGGRANERQLAFVRRESVELNLTGGIEHGFTG